MSGGILHADLSGPVERCPQRDHDTCALDRVHDVLQTVHFNIEKSAPAVDLLGRQWGVLLGARKALIHDLQAISCENDKPQVLAVWDFGCFLEAQSVDPKRDA